MERRSPCKPNGVNGAEAGNFAERNARGGMIGFDMNKDDGQYVLVLLFAIH